MPEPLQPVLLGLEGRAGILVAWRDDQGTLRAARNTVPEVPEFALLLTWPGSPASGAALDLARAVGESGGRVFPLGTVLRRVGVSLGRGWDGLLRTLLPDLELEDPLEIARQLLARVEEALAAEKPAPEPPPPFRPELASDLELLPDRPGVYRYLARDRSVLYLGKAASLRARAPVHLGPAAEPAKRARLVAEAVSLEWDACGSELEALLREYAALRRALPPLNTQQRVAERNRGALRSVSWCLVLPAVDSRLAEVCLVSGSGRFHWETVPREDRIPRGLWRRIRAFTGTAFAGWAPDPPGHPLDPAESAALAEITLTWLVRRGDAVSRIDLATETPGRALQRRLRALLAETGNERVEVR